MSTDDVPDAAHAHDALQRRLQAQKAEAVDDLNRWYTGVAVGHDPTPSECMMHYANHGGAENFARREAEQSSSDDPTTEP